jgi:hypothetical protein
VGGNQHANHLSREMPMMSLKEKRFSSSPLAPHHIPLSVSLPSTSTGNCLDSSQF